MTRPLVPDRWVPTSAAAIGVVGGVAGGLFGLGGGVVIVPALVLVLGMPQIRAASISLVAITVGTATSLVPFVSAGRVAWADGLVLAAAATAGAWAGTLVVHRIPERALAWGFVAVVGLAAIRLLLPGATGSLDAAPLTVWSVVMLVAVGLVAGALGTTLGIGGGAIYVTSLVMLLGLTQHTAQGTSLLAILPSALIGAVGHSRARRVRWPLAVVVSTGALVGGFAGATLAQRLPAERLQVAFAVVLMVLAVRMAVAASQRPDDPPPTAPLA